MASADLLDELSDELREAFAWAAAIELGDDIGTRSVLIGTMRAGRGRSDVDTLLRAIGVSSDELFAALQDVAPEWRIDPHVAAPSSDARRAVLTPNVERALQIAAVRRPSHEQGDPIEPRHLFGALLELPVSTAGRALGRVLGGAERVEQVAAVHRELLEHPDGRSFGGLLRERLGGGLTVGTTLRHPGSSIVRALAFSLGGDVAGAREDGTVVLWERGSTDGRIVLNGGSTGTAVAFSSDGDLLAAAFYGALVEVHSLTDGRRWSLVSPPAQLTSITWTPDDRGVVAVDTDGAVHTWELTRSPSRSVKASVEPPLPDRVAPLVGVAFSPSGELVTVDALGRRWVSERVEGEVADVARTFRHGPAYPALSRDGRWLAAVERPEQVAVLDLATHATAAVHHGHAATLVALALSADGRRLATAGTDRAVCVHDVDARARPEDRVEWLADAYAREDLLGRRHLAAAVAKRLDRMSEASPGESFLLHLDGPWGAGKSSILHFLRERLADDWLVVEFDAWRQSRVGPPWWALLTSLRKALRRQLGPSRGFWLRMRETAARLWRDQGVVAFVALLVAAAVAFLILAPGSRAVGAWIAAGTAAVAACTLLLGPGRGLAAFLMWDSAMGAKRYEQWHPDPMEGLAEHFAWLVARSPRPLVFFVDDLDRCDERHVVDLLDSIQTLVRDAAGDRLGARAPCFVVAADGRWIRRSYERTHEGFDAAIGAPGRSLGYLFVDKLFQLTVEVPTIGSEQQSAYLRRLLGAPAEQAAGGQPARRRIAESESQREILAAMHEASPQERADATAAALDKLSDPQVERATEHELQKFVHVLERNPRSMKRFVNAYSMALSTMLLEGRDVDPDELALWTIMRLRWPELAERLRERPDQLDLLVRDGASPAALGPLAALAGSHELQRIVHFKRPALSGEAIRRLTAS